MKSIMRLVWKLTQMKEFDYTIIGGGCAGLSLAYELEINNKLSDKTLAIIEPRNEYFYLL